MTLEHDKLVNRIFEVLYSTLKLNKNEVWFNKSTKKIEREDGEISENFKQHGWNDIIAHMRPKFVFWKKDVDKRGKEKTLWLIDVTYSFGKPTGNRLNSLHDGWVKKKIKYKLLLDDIRKWLKNGRRRLFFENERRNYGDIVAWDSILGDEEIDERSAKCG
jgi:hypothetical protein